MKIFLLLLILLSNTFFSFSQNKDEQTIRNIIAAQAQQWNKGNIDSFMIGYWENDSLLFLAGPTPAYGYKTMLNMYKKNYPDTLHMGKLTFEIIHMKKLSPKYYYAIGKWHLKRNIGDYAGYYTYIIQKIKHNWKIISDHSDNFLTPKK